MEDKKNNGISEWKPKSSDSLTDQVLSTYKFTVYIQGMKIGFSKITNIEEFVETEAFHEGGVNEYAYSLMAPVKQEKTMSFERGMLGVSNYSIVSKILLSRFRVGQRLPIDIVITVSGNNGQVEKMFFVHGATVKKWRCSDLDAINGKIMVETFEITYETLEQQDELALAASAVGLGKI